jgi:hypothetical protein
MIDDPTQVTALMQKMKAHLPIPAQATNALVRSLRASAGNIASKRRMQIEKVMYLGDEGGRARRHRCGGVAYASPPSKYSPARTRRTSIPNRTHEEIGRRIRQAPSSGRLRSLGCLVVLLPPSSSSSAPTTQAPLAARCGVAKTRSTRLDDRSSRLGSPDPDAGRRLFMKS